MLSWVLANIFKSIFIENDDKRTVKQRLLRKHREMAFTHITSHRPADQKIDKPKCYDIFLYMPSDRVAFHFPYSVCMHYMCNALFKYVKWMGRTISLWTHFFVRFGVGTKYICPPIREWKFDWCTWFKIWMLRVTAIFYCAWHSYHGELHI